jgi:hypothetical protein
VGSVRSAEPQPRMRQKLDQSTDPHNYEAKTRGLVATPACLLFLSIKCNDAPLPYGQPPNIVWGVAGKPSVNRHLPG